MPSKMGRPKAENPKTNTIRVRLDDDGAKKLDEYCAVHGITRADALRQGLDLLYAAEK